MSSTPRIIPGIVNVQPPKPTTATYPDEFATFAAIVHADHVRWESDGSMVTGPACWGQLRSTGAWVRAENWLGLMAGRHQPCEGPPEADDEEAARRKREHFARLYGSPEAERAVRMF